MYKILKDESERSKVLTNEVLYSDPEPKQRCRVCGVEVNNGFEHCEYCLMGGE